MDALSLELQPLTGGPQSRLTPLLGLPRLPSPPVRSISSGSGWFPGPSATAPSSDSVCQPVALQGPPFSGFYRMFFTVAWFSHCVHRPTSGTRPFPTSVGCAGDVLPSRIYPRFHGAAQPYHVSDTASFLLLLLPPLYSADCLTLGYRGLCSLWGSKGLHTPSQRTPCFPHASRGGWGYGIFSECQP